MSKVVEAAQLSLKKGAKVTKDGKVFVYDGTDLVPEGEYEARGNIDFKAVTGSITDALRKATQHIQTNSFKSEAIPGTEDGKEQLTLAQDREGKEVTGKNDENMVDLEETPAPTDNPDVPATAAGTTGRDMNDPQTGTSGKADRVDRLRSLMYAGTADDERFTNFYDDEKPEGYTKGKPSGINWMATERAKAFLNPKPKAETKPPAVEDKPQETDKGTTAPASVDAPPPPPPGADQEGGDVPTAAESKMLQERGGKIERARARSGNKAIPDDMKFDLSKLKWRGDPNNPKLADQRGVPDEFLKPTPDGAKAPDLENHYTDAALNAGGKSPLNLDEWRSKNGKNW